MLRVTTRGNYVSRCVHTRTVMLSVSVRRSAFPKVGHQLKVKLVQAGERKRRRRRRSITQAVRSFSVVAYLTYSYSLSFAAAAASKNVAVAKLLPTADYVAVFTNAF